jgi:hypothetical protein
MAEWPQERRQRESQQVRVYVPSEIPATLFVEVNETGSFKALVDAIADGFGAGSEPQGKLAELVAFIEQASEFADYDDTARQALLALACVEALRRNPARSMWEFLWSLAWHSAALAAYLPKAVVISSQEPGFRERFLAVARDVVLEANRDPGRRAIEREKEAAANLKEYWRENARLSSLWRGNFTHSFHAVHRDDDDVLSIVATIDAGEFIQLLSLFEFPDPIAHALMWPGAGRNFEIWRQLAEAAPVAFTANAQWNGSLVLPLLLSSAREEIQQSGLGPRSEASEISRATGEIKSLAAEIAQTLARRPDARSCTARWGNWLVHDLVRGVSSNAVPHPTDAASRGFIEDALLDALIIETPATSWSHEASPDSEPWEAWCQLVVGTSMALAAKSEMPSPSPFLDEWALSPEDWLGDAGKSLKHRALAFETAPPRADAYGARLLAIPIVEAERADTLWHRFWASTAALREIVEFGDPDEIATGGWQGKTDAARLLMLQFSVGLMMMDHLISPQRTLRYDRRSAIQGLFRLLSEALHEMAAIDQLNGKFWSESARHLAIRRGAWLSDGNEHATREGIVLDSNAKPTLADFIHDLAGDTENLLVFAYVAMQNGIAKAQIAEAFTAAEIDLGGELNMADRLRALSPKTMGLTEAQLEAIRGVLSD